MIGRETVSRSYMLGAEDGTEARFTCTMEKENACYVAVVFLGFCDIDGLLHPVCTPSLRSSLRARGAGMHQRGAIGRRIRGGDDGDELTDDVCPPSTQFAACNHITVPKSVLLHPDFWHEALPDCDAHIGRLWQNCCNYATRSCISTLGQEQKHHRITRFPYYDPFEVIIVHYVQADPDADSVFVEAVKGMKISEKPLEFNRISNRAQARHYLFDSK